MYRFAGLNILDFANPNRLILASRPQAQDEHFPFFERCGGVPDRVLIFLRGGQTQAVNSTAVCPYSFHRVTSGR